VSKDITVENIGKLFVDIVNELQEEPEFQRGDHKRAYACNKADSPQIKVAIGNMPLDYDLWQDLRNPAVVGLYPAGLPEIWEFHANRRKQKTDESGRQTIFQIPKPFEFALDKYNRAVFISMMLPFSHETVYGYVSEVIGRKNASSHVFAKMYDDISRMADKAVTRVAIQLASEIEDVVVVMNNENVKALSTEVIPQTRQGISHGPCKGGNYPQKSLAVLLGLGQFGVSRMVFRDEIINNKVQRFAGPIRSIVIFDKQPLISDGRDGIIYPSKAWRQFLMRLFDFTDTDSALNKNRFCTFIPLGDSGCSKCIESCPSGAQLNSIPRSNGQYSEQISRQVHRFWKGKLQFDFNSCQDERGQLSGLYPEWSCARCLTVCLDRGTRRKQAVTSFSLKISDLAKMES
jgi:hypothetical protein